VQRLLPTILVCLAACGGSTEKKPQAGGTTTPPASSSPAMARVQQLDPKGLTLMWLRVDCDVGLQGVLEKQMRIKAPAVEALLLAELDRPSPQARIEARREAERLHQSVRGLRPANPGQPNPDVGRWSAAAHDLLRDRQTVIDNELKRWETAYASHVISGLAIVGSRTTVAKLQRMLQQTDTVARDPIVREILATTIRTLSRH